MKYTLNIGLNVGNSQPTGQLMKTFKLVKPIHIRAKTTESTYQGNKEKVFICEVDYPLCDLDNFLQYLCVELQQECIAYKGDTNEQSGLIFNPNYTGEQYAFDINLFKTF